MDSLQVILDADGVLLNFVEGFSRFMRRLGHSEAIPHHRVRDFSLGDLFPQVSFDDRLELMHRFLADDSFASIPHQVGAREAIDVIRRDYPDVAITALTAIGTCEKARAARISNLLEFGITDVRFVSFAGSKADELAHFPAGSIFVDDLPKHVDEGIAAGHRSYLFRQPHNTETTRLPALETWREGVGTILSDLAGNRPAPSV